MRYLRYVPFWLVILCVPLGLFIARASPYLGGIISGVGILVAAIGLYDLLQVNHAVLKNYPLIARLRFMLEGIRPEIRQYFLESDHEEVPYSREQRALVYRRAKGMEGLRPFGTLLNVHQIGHEWIN
ncbi:MAG: FMN-binding glutamate synthase family protein, partial [Pseudomonadota bacterium]